MMGAPTNAKELGDYLRGNLPATVSRDDVASMVEEMAASFFTGIAEIEDRAAVALSELADLRNSLTTLKDSIEGRDNALAMAADSFLAIHEHATNPGKVRECVSDGLDAINEVTPIWTSTDALPSAAVISFPGPKRPITRPTDNPPPNGAA